MFTAGSQEEDFGPGIDQCLGDLAKGNLIARERLIEIAAVRMRSLAHRMLRRFPAVRRWDDTDDVVQNAAIRLCRSLSQITPRDVRGFLGLVAVHVRRELLDLARKHAGPESIAANHETNVVSLDREATFKTDDAQAAMDPPEELERWTELHRAADALSGDERELFHLVWYLGLTQEQAATLLGCSVRTVKRHWNAAKTQIKAKVQGFGPA